MRKIDKDGLLLCDLQARVFEMSVERYPTSSDIFVRRFMNSNVAHEFDNQCILEMSVGERDILLRIDEQYGRSDYGSVKYSKNEMFWIGYVYRFFSYTYEMSSLRVYRIIKTKELRGLFNPYHTMDCSQAIERILEAKGLHESEEEKIDRQYRIYRRIRDH